MAETSCNQFIDSAAYLLTINLPTLKSVAMSLYDIMYIDVVHRLLVDCVCVCCGCTEQALVQLMLRLLSILG